MLERMGQNLTKHGNDFDGKGKNLRKAAIIRTKAMSRYFLNFSPNQFITTNLRVESCQVCCPLSTYHPTIRVEGPVRRESKWRNAGDRLLQDRFRQCVFFDDVAF